MNADGQNDQGFRGSETPTPPAGVPMGSTDEPTPPAGIEGLSGIVDPEDFGRPSPAVLGGESATGTEQGEAGEWPTLEYRSRNKPERSSSAGLDWLRGRRQEE